MTDDARIERLTELARQVWPGHAHALVVGVEDGIDVSAEDPIAFVDTPDERLFYVEHERGLDALEAALETLAAPYETRVVKDGHVRDAFVAGGMQALEERDAWVEQLAQQWEAMADDGEGGTFRECARELRARASKPCE